jgi:hypothetical protein
VDALSETEAEAPGAPDPKIGRLVDERFKILESLASGSMGAVFKAERVPVGKLVAIKFLHASFAKDSEFLARFERETRVMSKLTHPNCVTVVDFGVWEGAPYLVMEYVAGITLRALIDEGALPPSRALVLARQIAAGLAHAHAQGIVHRDVKPANIMISEEIGTGDHVRILDFGLARLRGAVGRDATQSNVVVGTPNYMAPEQTIGGGTIDARTDVYAVGVVLYEMIVGERPFQAEDTLALLGMHRAAPIPSLADRVKPGLVLPEGLQDVVEKAMAKAPGDRYQSAIELADAIDSVSSGRATGEHRVVAVRRTGPTAALAPTMLDIGSSRISQPQELAARDRKSGTGFGSFLFLLLALGVAAVVWYSRFRATDPGTGSAPAAIGPGSNDEIGSAVPVIAVDASAEQFGVGSGSSAGSGSDIGLGSGSSSGSDMVGSGRAIGVGSGSAIGVGSGSAIGVGFGSAIGLGFETGIGLGSGSGEGSGSAAGLGPGSGAGSAVARDEIEMDPATVEDPNPTQQTAEDEAADAPETPEDVEKRAPTAPVLATTVTDAVQLIKEGKRDLALASLRALWKKSPASSYIPFLLGNLYNDRLWWSVAMDHYKAAIAKNGRYKGNPTLNRNVIRMLASTKTQRKASGFLRSTIGKPAVPYLKTAAARDGNANVRRQAAALARAIR